MVQNLLKFSRHLLLLCRSNEWLENGVDFMGMGSLLTKGSAEEIAANAKKVKKAIDDFRNK